MDDLLNNEPVRRAQEALKRFDNSLNVEVLEKTARTEQDASIALGCEVGAIVKSLLFILNFFPNRIRFFFSS